jgi:hypothetical protein
MTASRRGFRLRRELLWEVGHRDNRTGRTRRPDHCNFAPGRAQSGPQKVTAKRTK